MSRYKRKEEMYPVVEDYLASGLSGAAYCIEHNLNQGMLSYWLGKYRSADDEPDVKESRSHFVTMSPISDNSGLVIELPGGIRILPNQSISDPGLINFLTQLSAAYA